MTNFQKYNIFKECGVAALVHSPPRGVLSPEFGGYEKDSPDLVIAHFWLLRGNGFYKAN